MINNEYIVDSPPGQVAPGWTVLFDDTYTTHQWYVVLEVFCVVYVGKPPTQHVVVGLPTCVVGGRPTITCCCWFTNMCCWR